MAKAAGVRGDGEPDAGALVPPDPWDEYALRPVEGQPPSDTTCCTEGGNASQKSQQGLTSSEPENWLFSDFSLIRATGR